MRVQVASFLWTSLGRTPHRSGPAGRRVCASGRVFLIVRGAHPNDTSYARVLFELPCPGNIIYRWLSAVMPGAVRTVLETLRPDAWGLRPAHPESLGRWGRQTRRYDGDDAPTSVAVALRANCFRVRPRRSSQTSPTREHFVVCTGSRAGIRPHQTTNAVTVPLGVDLNLPPAAACARSGSTGPPRRRSC